MAKTAHNTVLDAPFGIIDNANRMQICSGAGAPASVAAAVTAKLADVALTPGAGGASFGAIGAGTPDGRAMQVTAQSAVPIDASGDATHVVLDDGTNVLYATTCTTQTLTSGGTVNVPAWTITFRAPS